MSAESVFRLFRIPDQSRNCKCHFRLAVTLRKLIPYNCNRFDDKRVCDFNNRMPLPFHFKFLLTTGRM